MGRKSLVLNGFLGGINKDGDASDLESEDRQGRNELVTCTNLISNKPGRVIGDRPVTAAGESLVNTETADLVTEDFLIHGTDYYNERGVYKLGDNVEWSGKNAVKRPSKEDFGSSTSTQFIKTDAIGLDAYGTAVANTEYLFYGKYASLNGGSCLIADNTTLDENVSNFLRWGMDGDDDYRLGDTETWHFYNYITMGTWNSDSDAEISLWDSSLAFGGGNDAHETTGANAPSTGNHIGNVTDISGADYIRFGKNASDDAANDIGVIFRTGRVELDSDTNEPVGLYEGGLNILNKNINVEFHVNADTGTGTGTSDGDYGGGTFWANFDHLNITASCKKDNVRIDYSDSDYDSYCRTWEISKASLSGHGCEVADGDTSAAKNPTTGGARFTIAYDSAVTEGSNFDPTNVRMVAVVLSGSGQFDAPDHTDPLTIWIARLFELSFSESDEVGWANTTSLFSQTKLYGTGDNAVESLPQLYENPDTSDNATDALKVTTDATLAVTVYQPNTADYEGKIYYQEGDKNGNGIGSLFLIAEVSQSKGVKSILSDFYKSWNTITVAGAYWDHDPVDRTITHTANPNVRAGMRVSGHAHFPTNTYVATVEDTEHFELSADPTGTVASGAAVSITLSGTVELTLANPPVSSTYQLESGNSSTSETINALWNHSAAVGRQVYIGNTAKTGDYIPMELNTQETAGLLGEDYPLIDTIGYTGTTSKTYWVEIVTDATPDTFRFKVDTGSGYGALNGSNIAITAGWMSEFGDGTKIKFPTTTGYSDGDIWTYELKWESDLILKSSIGKRYGFPNIQYIDLELPNTGITAMAAAGDRLLVFSADMLNIVNVAQDYEFLEASLQGHGVTSKKMVCRVLEGVAFANSTGVYYFDGNNMNAISDEKMTSVAWSGAVAVSYLADEKLICVWHNTDDAFAYSLITKQWVSNSLSLDIPLSNTAFYQNKAHFLKTGPALKQLTMGNADAYLVLETGKISCGDLARKKRFKKVHVTVKEGATDASNCLKIEWSIDGATYETAQKLTVDNGINTFNINTTGKTIQFKFTHIGTVDAGVEISDIALIYIDRALN